MRFRQVHVRYAAVIQLPRPLGDPWNLPSIPTVARPEWRPTCDLTEDDQEWRIKVELAGMQEEDFEIQLYEDRLIIQGYRAWPPACGEARFHIAEIRYGPFRLEVPVLGSVQREKVSARYEAGFLSVSLPKLREEQ